MLKNQKPIWIKTVKLLSTDLAEDFCDELECEDVYVREIIKPIRQIVGRNMDSGDFDLWNTGLERDIPGKLLDIIEEDNDTDTACDLEDYFLKMEKRLVILPVFEYWYTAFSDTRENGVPVHLEEKDEKTNETLAEKADAYLDYVEEFMERLRKAEPSTRWDTALNGLGAIYMEDSDDPVEIDIVRRLIYEYSFSNISCDFWESLTELLGDDTAQLKVWAAGVLGEETLPAIPVISDDPEDEPYDE